MPPFFTRDALNQLPHPDQGQDLVSAARVEWLTEILRDLRIMQMHQAAVVRARLARAGRRSSK